MRRLNDGDQALYCGLYTDAETMRFIAEPWSQELAMRTFSKVLAQAHARNGPNYFAMLEKDTQRSIGVCVIQRPDAQMQRAELGIMLASQARTRGYATEALPALIATAFLALPIDTVWVQYQPANTAAERLFIGLGFLPATDVAIGDVHHAQCTRAMHRSAWHALS